MINPKMIPCAVFLLLCAAMAFGQTNASALRDYVGIIHQSYHPDVVEYLEKVKERSAKRGNKDAEKAIENYLKGGFGTGFIYVAANGDNYIITNNHVISQAYKISITFEKLDGAKTTYDRLKIIAADENIDIAIIAFDNGVKPFKTGLSFVTTPAQEGDDVFAAGFPGLGKDAIWQFSKGIISNAAVRFTPDDDEDNVSEVSLGPFIQHTAQIDPGNSGGPLLVQNPGNAGYAVAGINTLSARGRQAANYAIPADRALAYIKSALGEKDPVKERANLDARIDAFIKSLDTQRAVYTQIAKYLSNSCTASNAEYAVSEVFDRAPLAVQQAIYNVLDYFPLYGMNYAVAWLIEDSLRGKKSKSIHAVLDSVAQNADGSYNVVLKMSDDRSVNLTWINEYGIWRIEKAGDLVAGDKTLMTKKERDKEADEKIRSDYSILLAAAYTFVIDGPSAVVMVLLERKTGFVVYGADAFFGEDFFHIGGRMNIEIPYRLKAAALLPYLGIGLALRSSGFANESPNAGYETISDKYAGIGLTVQTGLKFTTKAVPGLYGLADYQYSWLINTNSLVSGDKTYAPHYISFGLGYAF